MTRLLAKCQSSYYSVSYGARALKIRHDTEHDKVGEQHISQKNPLNSMVPNSGVLK